MRVDPIQRLKACELVGVVVPQLKVEVVLPLVQPNALFDRLELFFFDFRLDQSFEKMKKPLLEFVQYAILLTDYEELPKDVADRAKARLAKLNQEAGRPLRTVANWMNQVEKWLAQEVTRKDPTQRKETEIVYALDKLIELQEARERKT